MRVDWIRCEGYGVCGDLAPELFDLDEWRYPILRSATIDPSLVHDAQRVVDCCPMKALILEKVRADEGVRTKGVRTERRAS